MQPSLDEYSSSACDNLRPKEVRISAFDPWVGPVYKETPSKLLVLGESRYDKEFTDRRIIEARNMRRV